MLDEPTLFDCDALTSPMTGHAWLRSDASGEEAEAAATIANVTGSHYRVMMLEVHASHPEGLTDDRASDLVNHPDMPPPRAASRRGELAKWGWLTKKLDENGELVKGKTRTGHSAQVWVLTDAARQQIRLGVLRS